MTAPMNSAPDPARVGEIAAGLTAKQREMLTRPNGRYRDDAADILFLLNSELMHTGNTTLGEAVRNHIMEARNEA